jgi:hypothetical protein
VVEVVVDQQLMALVELEAVVFMAVEVVVERLPQMQLRLGEIMVAVLAVLLVLVQAVLAQQAL